MAKVKISVVAKDLNMVGKELVTLLKGHGVEKKSTTSSLEDRDLDLVFEVLTRQYDDGTPIEELYAQAMAEMEEKRAKMQAEAPPEPEKEPQPIIKKEMRRVDTRSSSVDVEKFEMQTKLEEIVPEIKGQEQTHQKIKKGRKQKPEKTDLSKTQKPVKKEAKIEISVPEVITVGDLAEKLKKPAAEVIKRLMLLDKMATINDILDYDTAALVAEDMNAIVTKEIIVTDEDILFNDIEDDPASLKNRPPVVVIMGHVDHGKTSLLDSIRETSVTSTEAGGITQHIGAYRISLDGRPITFLDTPGHEAFTAMRARGAQVTDIAILVVAADDGIMPQTVEAINHARAANVNIIVAINKMDKEGANADKIMQELTEYELLPEAWGGDVICVPVSARTGDGISELLEMVLLVAEMNDLKSNPDRAAKGTVIESRLDKGKGVVATVLVQNGTLRIGDLIVAGTAMGKIRAMSDDNGKKVTEAAPSFPVEVLGLSETPEGGDLFYVVNNERMARAVVESRKQKIKDDINAERANVTLDDLFARIDNGDVKDLNIIVKADVQGSVEAVKQSLVKLSNEEVSVNIIHGGVGAVTETDVMLAEASNAIIVGFNVRPTTGASDAAAHKGVDVRLYRIIYEAIEEIESAMKGMLAPKYRESITGHAEIRQTFKVSNIGTIAGCMVKDGKILRNSSVRIVRDGIVVFEGLLSSLKRFKDDAKEVSENYECGMSFERFNDIKEGDIVEAYIMEEIKQ